MSRPLRLDFAGAFHHCFSRGNERRAIFIDDEDRNRFLGILAAVSERYGFMVHAYVLMLNHYHLFLETMMAGLSAGMRDLNGLYSEYFNARYARVGHLFQGRFKSILVQKESYLLTLSRYIHQNPVRAGLVKEPWNYSWSSCRDFLGMRPAPSWLNIHLTLDALDTNTPEAILRYKDFLSVRAPSNPLADAKGQAVLGDEPYVESIKALHQGKIISQLERPARHSLEQRPSAEAVLAALFAEPAIVPDLKSLWHRRSRDRDLAVYSLRKYAGMSLVSVGRILDISPAAVSNRCSRVEALVKSDQAILGRLDLVELRLRGTGKCKM